jgi:alpha-1,6-mannosyltransferase
MAAAGMTRLHMATCPPSSKGSKDVALTNRLAYVIALLFLILSFASSCVFLAVSSWNYPGGQALDYLAEHLAKHSQQSLISSGTNAKIHVDVASAMSGVSLFGQRAAQERVLNVQLVFDKAGYEDEHVTNNVDWAQFTHILTENGDFSLTNKNIVVVASIQGNPRLDLRKGRLSTSDAIFILQRKDWLS